MSDVSDRRKIFGETIVANRESIEVIVMDVFSDTSK